MNIIDQIILLIYFPKFSRPKNSRFEKFFINLSKYEKKEENILSNIINPTKVIQGEDRRTTLIIKNIPKFTKKRDIRELIEKFGNINFLSLTPDNNSHNFIIAYLNVINYKSVASIFMGLRKHKFNYFDKEIKIEIYYSNIQGKEELKKFFNDWN